MLKQNRASPVEAGEPATRGRTGVQSTALGPDAAMRVWSWSAAVWKGPQSLAPTAGLGTTRAPTSQGWSGDQGAGGQGAPRTHRGSGGVSGGTEPSPRWPCASVRGLTPCPAHSSAARVPPSHCAHDTGQASLSSGFGDGDPLCVPGM